MEKDSEIPLYLISLLVGELVKFFTVVHHKIEIICRSAEIAMPGDVLAIQFIDPLSVRVHLIPNEEDLILADGELVINLGNWRVISI